MSILHTKHDHPGRWRTSLNFVLGALLPQRCLVCDQASGASPVCADCAAQLPRLPYNHCPVCAHPHETPATAGLPCGACIAHPRQFDATFALYAYAAPADALIQSLKYRRRLASADFLASALVEVALRLHTPVRRILPMPLSPQRLAERGFNQAVELARPVARALGQPLDLDSIRRIHHRAAQMSLPWKARAANVRHVFVGTRRFDGEHILIVDDVMTTGATLDELARLLKLQGAARVSTLVVARTLRHREPP